MYRALQYWQSHRDELDTLDERDRREIIIEIEAEKIRTAESGKYDWNFLSNREKLEIMQRWYPRAYRTVKNFYPGFAQEPDDYPRGIARSINSMIANLIGGRDRVGLQFT